MSKEHLSTDATASGGVSPEERRADVRAALPGLLFGIFTLVLTFVGVGILLSATFR